MIIFYSGPGISQDEFWKVEKESPCFMLTYWKLGGGPDSGNICIFERVKSGNFLQRGREGQVRPVEGIGPESSCDVDLHGPVFEKRTD